MRSKEIKKGTATLLGFMIVLMSALSGLPAHAAGYEQYGAGKSPGGYTGMHFWNSADNHMTFCQLQFDRDGLHAWDDKYVARPGEHFDAGGSLKRIRPYKKSDHARNDAYGDHKYNSQQAMAFSYIATNRDFWFKSSDPQRVNSSGGITYKIFGLRYPGNAYQKDRVIRASSDRGAAEAMATANKIPATVGVNLSKDSTNRDRVFANLTLKNHKGIGITGSKYPVTATISGPGVWEANGKTTRTVSTNGKYGIMAKAPGVIKVTLSVNGVPDGKVYINYPAKHSEQILMFGKTRNLSANSSITVENFATKFVTASDLVIDEKTGNIVDAISVTSADKWPDIKGVPVTIKVRNEIYGPYMSQGTQGSNPDPQKLVNTVFAEYKPSSANQRTVSKKVNFPKINNAYGYYTVVSKVLKSDQSAAVKDLVAADTRSTPFDSKETEKRDVSFGRIDSTADVSRAEVGSTVKDTAHVQLFADKAMSTKLDKWIEGSEVDIKFDLYRTELSSNGVPPEGAIPENAQLVHTTTETAKGNGDVESGPYKVTEPGYYSWVLSVGDVRGSAPAKGDWNVHKPFIKKESFLVPEVAEVGTTALLNGEHIADALSSLDGDYVDVVDVVSYKGLVPGKEYTISGVIMDAKTGKPVPADTESGDISVTNLKFTPTEKEGTINVTFSAPKEAIKGKKIVVFETIKDPSDNDRVVGKHEEILDENQTVYLTEVQTQAWDTEDKDQVLRNDDRETVKFTDTIKYGAVKVGEEYTVTGSLVFDDGTPVEVDGKQVTNSVTFTAKEEYGTVDVPFEVPASVMRGKTVVVFEDLYYKDRKIGTHADLEDKSQTVWSPTLESDTITQFGDKILSGTASATLDEDMLNDRLPNEFVDVIKFRGVQPHETYTIKGTVWNGDKQVGEGSVEMTPDSSNGEIKMLLTVDEEVFVLPSDLEVSSHEAQQVRYVTKDGAVLDVKLEMVYGELTVATHNTDKKDDRERVYIPAIGTKAVNENNTQFIIEGGETVVTDTVSYCGVIPGKTYTMTGKLMDQETGDFVEGVENTVEFTANDKGCGEVDVPVTIPAELNSAKAYVFGEVLKIEGREIAWHFDVTDEEQTVWVPKLQTTASDVIGGDKNLAETGKSVVVDIVDYEGMRSGEVVKVNASLRNVADPKTNPVDGVTRGYVATDEEIAKLVELFKEEGHEINLAEDLAKVRGTSVDNLACEGIDLEGCDPNANWFQVPDPNAKDAPKGTEASEVESPKGTEESAEGEETEGTDPVEGKEPEGEELVEVTPAAVSGQLKVLFEVDSAKLSGQTLVAFEQFEARTRDNPDKWTEIGRHENPEDDNQRVYVPKIGTTAEGENGRKVFNPEDTITVNDTIEYCGLEPGKEYTANGELMHHSDNGLVETGIKNSQTFTPKEPCGTVTVPFTFKAGEFAGDDLTVFEEVLDAQGDVVATHQDENDKDQTISIEKFPPKAVKPKSGVVIKSGEPAEEGNNNLLFGAVALLSLSVAGAVGVVASGRRKTM